MPIPKGIVRSQGEIEDVLNFASAAMDDGSKFPGMSYEDGVDAMYRWLVGETEDRPDAE